MAHRLRQAESRLHRQRIVGEGLDGTSKPHLLATKIGAWQAYNHTVEDCLAEVRDNLRVLRRDRVDVLLGHDMERARFWKPDAEDTVLDTDEPRDYESAPVMQAMREARAHGLCRYLGLSSNLSEPLAQRDLVEEEIDEILPSNAATVGWLRGIERQDQLGMVIGHPPE